MYIHYQVILKKDLDIIFDNTLIFHCHISHVVNRTNKLLDLVERTFKALNLQLFLTLCKTLI